MTEAMADFLDKVAQVLEVDSLTPTTRFRELDDWCSLKAFGLLVLLENTYLKSLDMEELLRLETVAELAAAAQVT